MQDKEERKLLRKARKKRRKARRDGDLSEYIMLSLLKEGPLTLEGIQNATALQTVDISSYSRTQKVNFKGVQACIEDLTEKQLLKLNSEGKYELTDKGKTDAQVTSQTMEKGAAMLENQLLSPSATARNTIISYVIIAVLQLFAGFFSGSVGLIADGGRYYSFHGGFRDCLVRHQIQKRSYWIHNNHCLDVCYSNHSCL